VATAPDPRRGNLLAALSGLAWALTLTGLRWLSHSTGQRSALATVVAGNALATAFCLPMAVPVPAFGVSDAVTILYLGAVQIGVGYLCLTRGMRQVPAFEASILLLLEPVMNPVWTWLVHGERPAALALAGGAVIVGSTVWKMLAERNRG
jgi:drug/metabolite transporter (DMT)-like permease